MTVRQEKIEAVEEISIKLKESKSTIITDYRGLSVAQVTELRKLLREKGVEYKVYKNTLAQRAAAELNLSAIDQFLIGPTAIAFSKNDLVAPAKILSDFAKKNDKLQIKGGLVEGRVIDVEGVKQLASLPSREGLLSMLLSVIQAPIRNFALAVKAVSDQKGA